MKTLKEIGVVPDKIGGRYPQPVNKFSNKQKGFNQAIDLMSSKKVDVVIDREELAYRLWNIDKKSLNFSTWNYQKEPKSMEWQYGLKADALIQLAQAINQNLKDILEVCND